MSGHSKWATTKRAKAVVDAKRGAAFTKFSRLISLAAKAGGDPETNFQLRDAIDKARGINMPKDNIERAIKRGTGEDGGDTIEELVYEGMGPAGVQFVIRVLTDNRNRSAANIRHLLAKHGGSLGAVLWNFEQKSVFLITREAFSALEKDYEEFFLEAIEAGFDDIINEEDGLTLYGSSADFAKLKQWLLDINLSLESSEIEFIAKEKVKLNEADKKKIEAFIEALEEDDDIRDYASNLDD